ncbi:efflux RND transporter permease subunit [Rheinheimera pleomorphica]|uniref:efflux RND transporter permease subunit n=1 Tax=Rheinheimera pleomorphica TaxID=2703963 RepID=UPI0014201CEC|nr:CusA/CzcA family heavy metal efflux RND transporter [Rheinheimera pleomorphica]
MIDLILKFALSRRYLVLGLTLLMAALGIWHAQRLPMDAVPDITNVQVQINTEAPGYSPLETEQRLTLLIENAMAGLPKLEYTRSLSRYAMSQVTVVFEDGTDIYWARQQISERLQSVRSQLPPETEPALGPITTGLGEILMYSVTATPDARKPDGTRYSPEDLRTLQDYTIKPQLVKVRGVTEVNSIGGYVRQYQVAPDVGKLLAFKLTLDDLATALSRNNANVGAGYIERHGAQWLVRSPGQLRGIDDIANLVLAKRDDAPVRVRDVAEVFIGKELRTGAALQNGAETVLGTVFMLRGENSRTVSQRVAQRLQQINLHLPDGVQAVAVYNRSSLVDKTIQTVQKNLFEGAVLVIVVLFIFLGNIRAAFITALVIPLSMLFAISGMALNRVSGNLMSLGAIDFGLMVDGAVIVVENCLRRLGMAQHQQQRLLSAAERLEVVYHATREVFSPAVFGVLIIMLVFLPIFALSGVEGKMFHPMAFTVIAALLGALILAVTFVPAAIALLVRGKVAEQDSRLLARLKASYQPVLKLSLHYSGTAALLALLLIGLGGYAAAKMGSEFMPQLDEGDVALHALRVPGTGLEQAVKMQQMLEQEIMALPQVERVFSKIGTAEIATDPMPPSVADTFVILKPQAQWPDPALSKAAFVELLRQKVQAVPGNNYEFTQPIEMRFNELIAGVRTDVAVRIYGDDLEKLKALGEQASAILATVPGAIDVRMEQATGLPLLSVEPEREHLALLGIDVATVQQTLQTAVGGLVLGQIFDGDKRFPLLVRLHESQRTDLATLARLPVALPTDAASEMTYVPLGEVAQLVQSTGPNQINRESGKRNIVVTANVAERDLGSFIADTQQALNSQLSLPAGYWLGYGGTFEQLQSATARLQWLVPLTLLLIFGLLFSALNSAKDALIVFSGVPLALTGGIAALLLRDMPLSISAAVGFIALSGIAVLNGVVMMAMIKQLREQGMALTDAITQGAVQRLRPVLMTALVASLGFVPMAFNSGTGAEIQRPLASVVIGGIITSTLLTLVILPALYRLMHQHTSKTGQQASI